MTGAIAGGATATAFANVAVMQTAAGVTTTASLTGLGQAVAGMAAGSVGGWGASGNSRGALYGAASGGFGNYLSNGTIFANPIERASTFAGHIGSGNFGAAGSMLGNTAMNYGFQRVEASIARHYGISPEAFNIGLMGLSMAGNGMLGSRFVSDDRFSSTQKRGFLGFGSRGAVGIPFDIVDTMLEYQGLPTASMRDYLVGYAGLSVSGHSLGAISASNAIANGLSPGGAAYALPFGNIAPPSLTVNLGAWDAVSGGYLGKLFNPGANICSVGFGGHSLNAYAAGC